MFRLLQIAKVQVPGMGDRIGQSREPMIGNQRLNRTKSQERVVSEPKAPPTPPPSPSPKELTSEQQERILKSGIAISNLAEEKLSVIEPKDRELLTDLMARVTGPDKHQPSLDEIKEVQRIVSGFHENVMSRWQEGTQTPEESRESHQVQGRQHSGMSVDKRSRVSPEALEALNKLDKDVSTRQMQTGLQSQSQQVEEPQEPTPPRPKAQPLSEVIGEDVKGTLGKLCQYHEKVVSSLDRQRLTDLFKEGCGDIIKERDEAILPSTKEKAIKDVRDRGEEIVNRIGRNSTFLPRLQAMSPEERRQAITLAVGDVQGKEKLVNAILEGIDKALQNPQPSQKGRITPELRKVNDDDLKLVENSGRDHGRQLISSIKDDSVLTRMSAKSDEQLKYEISKTLGFSDKEIGSLSVERKQLVDSILVGAREELQARHFGPQQQEVDALVKQLTDRPRPLAPIGAFNMAKAITSQSSEDTKFGLSLKTGDELQQMVMLSLGEQGKDIKSLPEDKQKQIRSIVDGITEGLPNKVGGMTQIKDKAGQQIDVPSTIQIGGRTYGNPEHVANGGYGRVIKYTDSKTGESVVVKDLLDPTQREAMVRELQVHHKAMGPGGEGHENLVGLKGAVQGPGDHLYMVMDHVDGTDLYELTKTVQELKKLNVLSPSDDMLVRQFLGKGVLDGLIHMHELDLVHGDFKTPNSMYDRNNGQAKVIDLGTGRVDPQNVVTEDIAQEVQNPIWKAPELSKRGSSFDERVDAFSLGQSLHELVTGNIVFDSKFMSGIEGHHQKMLETGEQAMQGTQTSFTQVINSTFAGRPEDRAKLTELRQNSFFTDPLGSDERAQALLNKICDLAAINKQIDKLEEKKVDPNDPEMQKLKTQALDLQKELREMSARRNLGHED